MKIRFIPFCTAYSGPTSTLDDIVSASPETEHKDESASTPKR